MQPQTEYPESPQVAASSTLALVHYLETRGLLDRVRVEQATGLTLATLKDPDLRVPASAHYRLWELAEQLTADPGVGLHAGQVIDPERMGLVGHVFFNCDTLGEAVVQYVRLHRLINESVTLSFEQTPDQAILTWQPDRPVVTTPGGAGQTPPPARERPPATGTPLRRTGGPPATRRRRC